MTQVGSVYGQALYDLAMSEALSHNILQELAVLEESFRQVPEFLRLLAAQSIPKQERCQILDNSFRGKLHPYVLNFLKILTEKGYSKHFFDCVASYREHYNRDNGILPVTAVTATALTQAQADRLCEKLAAITGKTIQLHNKLDADVLGGIRLDYDGKSLDGTIANRLDAIRSKLKNTAL
jgi:F-type H+-transporting ATPase subunit delta